MNVFVITADQVASRSHPDIVASTIPRLDREFGAQLALPLDRTAGDELQALTSDAATALALVLDLTRGGAWSVGLGCGPVRRPLPRATREGSGAAFYAARDAVTRAKKAPSRFAVEDGRALIHGGSEGPSAADAESLVNLLLNIRERRTEAGWELFDLVARGLTQSAAARELGITAPSASARARAAGIRSELAAVPALTRLLDDLDRANSRLDTQP